MSVTTQRVCGWSGVVMIVIVAIGFFGGGLFPPLAPHASVATIDRFYGAHPTRLRAGLLVAFCGMGFWGPTFAAVNTQLQRIPRISPVLAHTQLMSAAASWVFLAMPLLILSAATFRPGRSTAVLQAMSDIGWFCLIMPIIPFIPQAVAIGVAVLQDRGSEPILPRWFGYFNLWVAILFVPGGLLTFFHTGPFDWRGLIALYIPFTVFAAWLVAIGLVLDRAIKREAEEPAAAPARA